jgi:hypothetical protein
MPPHSPLASADLRINPHLRSLRRLAAISAAAAVAVLWFALYRSLPTYPPSLGLPLAVAGVLFLSTLALVHRIHASMWPGIAQFGFTLATEPEDWQC